MRDLCRRRTRLERRRVSLACDRARANRKSAKYPLVRRVLQEAAPGILIAALGARATHYERRAMFAVEMTDGARTGLRQRRLASRRRVKLCPATVQIEVL